MSWSFVCIYRYIHRFVAIGDPSRDHQYLLMRENQQAEAERKLHFGALTT